MIAYLCLDRQLKVTDGSTTQRPTFDPAMASWAGATKTLHAWPTFSPDGASIACFQVVDPSGNGSRLLVTDPDGVRQTHVADLGREMPVYLCWEPEGHRLAWLTQASDTLVMYSNVLEEPQRTARLTTGRPLFFSWIGGRLVAYAGDHGKGGGARASRLVIVDPERRLPEVVLPGPPERFCTPVVLNEEVIYVARRGDTTQLVCTHVNTLVCRALGPHVEDGHLTGVVANPGRTKIASAEAPSGEGAPYYDLSIYDLQTHTWTPTPVTRCVAFTWCGEETLIAFVDEPRSNATRVVAIANGESHTITRFRPSREFTFYLRFFEQFVGSHPVCSPDGRRLLLGGLPAYTGDVETSRLWQIDLADNTHHDIDEGVFGVYGPASARSDG